MYKYYVNGKGRVLQGEGWCMWCVYDDDGGCIGSSSTILTAILEADYDNVTWDEAHMIESVIIDIMREREGKNMQIPVILQSIFMIAGFAWLIITVIEIMKGEEDD